MRTVLVVDDDRQTGRLMRFLLEVEGYRVVVTDAYDDILSLVQSTLPDAILMDSHIHGQRTLDLVQSIRDMNSQVADTYLVMTSAANCFVECMRAGADRYIPKPYRPDEVVEEIECLCG
jgi:DNA-binding response OmpR family regulator